MPETLKALTFATAQWFQLVTASAADAQQQSVSMPALLGACFVWEQL
jgi:hypothetical protein